MTYPLAKLGLLAAIPSLLLAQRYSFKQYGQDQGLTNLDVQCLMQDRTGFLWVATDGGLFRCDGRQFHAYTTGQGLPSAQVTAIHQTADGIIWAATVDGVARLNGETFEKVAIDAHGATSITSDAFGNLYIGSTAGLWTASPPGPSGQRQFRLYTAGGRAAQNVTSIATESTGKVWYGCGYGICTLDNGDNGNGDKGAKGRVTRLEDWGVPHLPWRGMLFDTHGNLWVRSTGSLIELTRGTRAFVRRDEGLPSAAGKRRSSWIAMAKSTSPHPKASRTARRLAGI